MKRYVVVVVHLLMIPFLISCFLDTNSKKNNDSGIMSLLLLSAAGSSTADVSDLTAITSNASVTLKWSEPSTGDYSNIEITYSPNGSSAIKVPRGTGSCKITDLTNNTAYFFTLKTINSFGNKSEGKTIQASPGVSVQMATSVLKGPSVFYSTAKGSDCIYAAGLIKGSPTAYDFGNNKTITVNNSNMNIVLVKYDLSGNAQWVKSIVTGFGDSYYGSIAVGSDGIYAVGGIAGNSSAYDFGNSKTITVNNSNTNIVLVKYDLNGTTQWVKSVTTGPKSTIFYSLSIGDDGIYAAGGINGSTTAYDFGNGKTIVINDNNSGNSYILLAKYDMNGNTLWVKSVATMTSGSMGFNSVAAGSDGIYAAGVLTGNAAAYDFGNSKTFTINNTNYNILLVKYDRNGVAQWAKSVVSGNNYSQYKSVAVGSDGIYAAGSIYDGTYDFGNSTTVGVSVATSDINNTNVILVKYNTDGNAQWARSVTTGVGRSVFYSVVAGSDGIYAAGNINHFAAYNYNFGNSITIKPAAYSYNQVGYENFLLMKYDLNGNAQWTKTVVASYGATVLNSIAMTSDGIFSVGGIKAGGSSPHDFGNGNKITINNTNDYFNTLFLKFQ